MGVLMWPPDGFWNATVYDVERALEGWRRANNVTDDGSPDNDERRKNWFESLPETA